MPLGRAYETDGLAVLQPRAEAAQHIDAHIKHISLVEHNAMFIRDCAATVRSA
jgi:hypothetical protein